MSDGKLVVRAGVVLGIAAIASLAAYAVYFDHKRRNDSAFRKRLRPSLTVFLSLPQIDLRV